MDSDRGGVGEALECAFYTKPPLKHLRLSTVLEQFPWYVLRCSSKTGQYRHWWRISLLPYCIYFIKVGFGMSKKRSVYL